MSTLPADSGNPVSGAPPALPSVVRQVERKTDITPRWAYLEPANPQAEDWSAVLVVMTENEILETYWLYWRQQMLKAKAEPITPAACIEDWSVVHWAWKLSYSQLDKNGNYKVEGKA